jgi:hypothetical protein
MEIQGRVHILEQAATHHVDLAATTLLRRRAVDADLGAGASVLEPLLHRNGRRHRGRAEQMMAASVSRGLVGDRLALGLSSLREARQRVHLRENRDHRSLIAAAARNEGGWNSRYTGLDPETGRLEFILQERRGLGLHVAKLRRRPDLERDLRHARRIGVDVVDELRLVLAGELCRESGGR